jgi:signal transduction histidine kinase
MTPLGRMKIHSQASSLSYGTSENRHDTSTKNDTDQEVIQWQWSMDGHFRIRSLSKKFQDLFGKQATAGLLGRTLWDFTDDVSSPPPAWMSFHKRLKDHQEFENYLFTLPHGDKKTRVEISGKPLFQNNQFRGYQGTGRLAVEDKNNPYSHLMDDLLHQAAKDMPVGIAVFDENGIFLEMNDSFTQIFHSLAMPPETGLSWESFIQSLVFQEQFLLTDNQQSSFSGLQKAFSEHRVLDVCLQTHKWLRFEFTPLEKGHEPRTSLLIQEVSSYYDSIQNLEDKNEFTRQQLNTVSTFVRNNVAKLRYSDKIEQTEALMQDIKTLKEQNSRLYNSPYQGVLRTAPDGTLISANTTLCHMLGVFYEKELKKTLKNVYHGLYVQSSARQFLEEKALKEGMGTLHSLEWRHIPSGRSLWVSETVYPLYENGQVAFFESLIVDQTLLSKKEKEVYTLQQQYTFDQQTKQSFLHHLSHELKTPLGAVLGFSEIMQQEMFGQNISAYKGYVTDIAQSGQHMLGLVNDTLTVLDYNHTQEKMSPVLVDVLDLIMSVKSAFSDKTAQKKSMLDLKLPSQTTLPYLFCDRIYVKEALKRLMENALSHTESGTEGYKTGGKITLGLRLHNDQAMTFFVHDTGRGMNQAFLEKATTPFSGLSDQPSVATEKNSDLGLGLSLAETFVKVHGGSLYIKTHDGLGTTTSLQFPAWRTQSRDALSFSDDNEYGFEG